MTREPRCKRQKPTTAMSTTSLLSIDNLDSFLERPNLALTKSEQNSDNEPELVRRTVSRSRHEEFHGQRRVTTRHHHSLESCHELGSLQYDVFELAPSPRRRSASPPFQRNPRSLGIPLFSRQSAVLLARYKAI